MKTSHFLSGAITMMSVLFGAATFAQAANAAEPRVPLADAATMMVAAVTACEAALTDATVAPSDDQVQALPDRGDFPACGAADAMTKMYWFSMKEHQRILLNASERVLTAKMAGTIDAARETAAVLFNTLAGKVADGELAAVNAQNILVGQVALGERALASAENALTAERAAGSLADARAVNALKVEENSLVRAHEAGTRQDELAKYFQRVEKFCVLNPNVSWCQIE